MCLMILINTQVVRQGCRSHVSQWLKPKLCNTIQDPDQYLWNVYSIWSLAISSILWLTYAFNFCDIYSCLTLQCSGTWLTLFTNIFWSSFSTACSDPWTSWKTLKQHHSEYPTFNFYYEHVPLLSLGQAIMRTGVEVMAPRRGLKASSTRNEAKARRTSQRSKALSAIGV